MRNILSEWTKIEKELERKDCWLFLDFDGTLTPIRKKPDAVKLSKATKDILKDISSLKDVDIAVISGRKLSEVRKLVGLRGIIYAGNHGLEAEGPGLKFAVPRAAKTKKVINKLNKDLKRSLRPYRGVLVENKSLTLSVHYRMVSQNKIEQVRWIFKSIAAPYKASGKIFITEGKKVLEIRPPVRWNKGDIVLQLLGEKKKSLKKKIVSFYIGDDRTDEDAFRRLKNRSYTVKVGKSGKEDTSACYYLSNTEEVRNFLKKLLTSKRRKKYV